MRKFATQINSLVHKAFHTLYTIKKILYSFILTKKLSLEEKNEKNLISIIYDIINIYINWL